MPAPDRLHDADWLAEQAKTRSASSIARELGVAPDTVLRALRIYGLPVRAGTALRRTSRRPELDDVEWLADRYAQSTSEEIADELDVAPSTVLRALRAHGIEVRDVSAKQQFRTSPELDDPEWLRRQYATKSGAEIARELGVSVPGVHKAMRRHGIDADGSWVRRDTRRLKRPPEERLQEAWEREGTIVGVARRLGVSHAEAAIWMADVGIFVSSTPAISRSAMPAAIEAGQTISEIAAEHGVGDRTVSVELRRHGLVDEHRRRPRSSGAN